MKTHHNRGSHNLSHVPKLVTVFSINSKSGDPSKVFGNKKLVLLKTMKIGSIDFDLVLQNVIKYSIHTAIKYCCSSNL